MNEDTLRRFQTALPSVQHWIAETINNAKAFSRSAKSLGFFKLEELFPKEIFDCVKVVVVSGKLPFPPLGHFGLSELFHLEKKLFDGITYIDTIFVNERYERSESLLFHELVHVSQWKRLGIERFLTAYGVGLFQFDYEESPLEKMAYELEAMFKNGSLYTSPVPRIEAATDAIWSNLPWTLQASLANPAKEKS
jgi:hypothetical protein